MTGQTENIKPAPADLRAFLAGKAQHGSDAGFAPSWLPDFLFPFQRSLVEWAVRKGRAAIFADCGLGKTPMELVWAENVVRHTARPVLILAPIAVASQTAREADKFGVECVRSSDGRFPAGARVVVTNYERLHHFDHAAFAGVACDESSVLKNFDGKRKAAVTEFMRCVPYRLLCTATAAPNDHIELGTSSEALGYMGFQDMIGMFFKQQTAKDLLGWGRTVYKLRGHAETGFWRWVCSWARACRKPSDLGFDDGPFRLPQLVTRETVVKSSVPTPEMLFGSAVAATLQDQRAESRRSLPDRCEAAARRMEGPEPGVAWCHLNDEGDLLEKLIPGAVQVSGSDPDEKKEEAFDAFATGQARVIVTKPTIGGFGLNWQHCNRMTFFPSHSFEQFYQSVRRCWRFGQSRPVSVDVVSSEGGAGVLSSLQRKADAADAMFARLVSLMNDHMDVGRAAYGGREQEVPSWL